MSLTEIAFYFLSFLAIFSALAVILSKNPVYSVLYLIVTFFSIAGHYFLMNAQFLAAVHIIVYAGAIMVLFLYVIMMLNLNEEQEEKTKNWVKIAAVVSACSIMLILVSLISKSTYNMGKAPMAGDAGLVQNLGKVLYKDYLLPFELASVLFLAAMVGAVYLSKKETSKS
jgi:NADH-quinone oxidoreductase subunit J